MENTGKITVTARPCDGQSVEIKVTDTGAGIPPENLSKLFTPFFTTKPAGKGTGLGLSIVYGIIKLHHGQITIQSQVHQGTTVTITLPLRQPNGESSQASSKDIIG
jgi:signal transduction histidine kinase